MALTEKQKKFIAEIAGHVQKYAKQYGISVHSPIIAQAILESGWGESRLAAEYHNYFGLKCGSKWTGKSVNMKTQEEYSPGTKTTITDFFRAFDSMEDGVKGYFEFIQLPRYQNLKGITDPRKYLQTIKDDGYATSSTYVSDVYACVTSYGLTQYDGSGKEGGTEGMTEAQARQKVVGIMQGWIGLKRSDKSHAPIIDAYNGNKPLPRGYKVTYTDAYCATTTSAAAIKAGYTDIIPVECSCYYLIEKAKAMGIWQENDAYVPKPGDEVLYDWDDGENFATTDNQGAPEHVGMVEAISGSTIRVMEGNMSGGVVGRRNLQINGRYIRGFICPNYASKATEQEPDAPQPGSTATGGGLNREAKWTGRTTTTLNVRKWAGKENDECSFSPLKDGEEISVCDEIQAADGSRWYYIKNKAGKYGFASAKYITAAGAGSGASAAPVSFKAGDKVKVTGTFYGNGNGTGGAIKKNGATMYVTELVDKATYKYYIGLAAKKGGARQGWAEPSIIEKI